jgi:hypothetical protein
MTEGDGWAPVSLFPSLCRRIVVGIAGAHQAIRLVYLLHIKRHSTLPLGDPISTSIIGSGLRQASGAESSIALPPVYLWSAAMPTYRLYAITSECHIAGPPTIINCQDDPAALLAAKQALKGQTVEIWNGPRLVARLKPENVASAAASGGRGRLDRGREGSVSAGV